MAIASGLALLSLATSALAAPPPTDPPEVRFERASKALEAEAYDAAILEFESLADRGFAHPDVSFDRGLAYARRSRTRDEQPGDLGRAAAGFEEALRLRPDDHEAEAALDAVRAEVTRQRARKAKDDLIVRPSLDRIVVGLASEETWSYAAIGASLLLALALLLRRKPNGPVHVAGSVLVPISVVALLALTPLALGARWLREHRRTGVIVLPEANLIDAEGRAINGASIPEASSVEVGDRHGDTILVRWGSTEGYASLASVRVLQD